MASNDKSGTGRKVSWIKLTLFGFASFIVMLAIAAWVLFNQFAWHLEFHDGLAAWPQDQQKGKQLLERAIHDCQANGSIAEQMSCHRAYAEMLYQSRESKVADEQIASTIALLQGDPPPNSEEANQLTHAYQDRAWNAHTRFLEDPSLPSGDKDQEMSVAVAEKAFGPDHEQTIYKIPSLAVIYADMNLPDKANETISRALTAADTKASAKECAWFVYCMDARLKAVERDYRGAVKSFLRARALAKDDSQRDRAWQEFTLGLRHGINIRVGRKHIVALIAKEKFAELDQVADKLRQAQTSNSDGYWELDYLYEQLEPRKNGQESDQSQRLLEVKKWLKDNPTSITARVGLADCLTEYAWFARGSGYGDSVSKQGWELFASRLKQAKSVLDADPSIKKKCPGAFRCYSKIALGQSLKKEDYMKLVDDCHKIWPTYANIDFGTCWFLLPRWYGEEHETEQFITTRADEISGTKGDQWYAQLVWYSERYLDDLFQKQSPIKWKRVKAGFKQIFAEFPDRVEARIEYMRLAIRAEDEESIKSTFDGYKPNW